MKGLRVLAVAVLLIFAQRAEAQSYRLQYEAQVLGVVPIGRASYEVSTSGGRYLARATVRTTGVAQLFDQTQISAAAAGALRAAGPAWSTYNLSHGYARKFRRIDMQRTREGVSAVVAPRFGDMGSPPATPAQQNASHDPLTAIFALGRQIGAAGACNGRVNVFDGRAHYRLSASGGTRGAFHGGGYNGPAIRCSLNYSPIAGYTNGEERRAAPPRADAWFALPADRGFGALLQLNVSTPVGPARLDLRGYEKT
ncbi:MAG: DUF3108 domain-containing protein [Caulobacterales bacterium]